MLKIEKIFLIQFIFILFIILANITGILKLIGGSVFAEGTIILLAIIFSIILLPQKSKYNFFDYCMIFIALYSLIITLFFCLTGNLEFSAFISFYAYVVPCLIFLNRNNIFFISNSNLYFKVLFFMIMLNSLYAIYQLINPNGFLPMDGFRASGLMKSTLNFSGMISLIFFPALFYKFKSNYYKYLFFIIITIGGFLSMSRGLFASIIVGYIFSFPIQVLISHKLSLKNVKKIFYISIIFIILLFLIITILNNMGILENFERLIHIVDYKEDSANVARYKFWISFIDYFINNPFGYGVGQLASGTSFVKNPLDFESYILGTIYSIGILGILYFLIPIIWSYGKLKNVSAENQHYIIMFYTAILFQNAIQPSMLTPTTLIFTWLTIIFFTNYIKNYDTK